MKYLLNKIKDFIYPGRCVQCSIQLPFGELGLCDKCRKKITYVDEPVCLVCGREVRGNALYCTDCRTRKHEFLAGRFVFPYEKCARGVYDFKYSNRAEYALFYADAMKKRWGDWLEGLNADALIPVPIHRIRLAKRGYNQAELLADELSKLIHVPVYAKYVRRVRNTVPQKLYDKARREINVKKAFIVAENSVKLKTVIVVDDIFTTGSTIDELSRELKKNGVEKIYFITITAAGS